MNGGEAEQFIRDLYVHVLRRQPGAVELEHWTKLAAGTLGAERIFRAFLDGKEYKAQHGATPFFDPGNYHSPIVDPSSVIAYHARTSVQSDADLTGVELDREQMLAFWDKNLPFIRQTSFGEQKSSSNRFFYDGSPYPWGDAIMLRAMINYFRPQHIMEIGSGFSTACMLDSADDCQHDDLRITCIEPYPDRLHSLLRPADYERVTVIASGVQDVELERFDCLAAGDILFIDSTHVLKTGSDVHYELFSILPRLRSGVLVHVHDCPFPFEYPAKWVFERNYSWNEAYALRAFLMYNGRFSIFFWNSYLARTCRQKLLNDYPNFLRNPGSSIWITAI